MADFLLPLPEPAVRTAVYDYVISGTVEQLRAHLILHPEELDLPQIFRRHTPLHLAAERGSKEKVELLLELGSQALTTMDEFGCLPIHLAVGNGHAETVRAIIQHHPPSLLAKTGDGSTPFFCAVDSRRIEAAAVLVELGGEAITHLEGVNSLFLLFNSYGDDEEEEMTEAFHRLLALGCGPLDGIDSQGNTIFHLAAMAGCPAILEYAFQQGVPHLNTKNENGWTPIFSAAEQGQAACIETLYRLGCRDLDLLDVDGCPPLSYAMLDFKRTGIVPLRALGASTELITREFMAAHPHAGDFEPLEEDAWTALTTPIPDETVIEIRHRACFCASLLNTLLAN